jgi:hypothetical protein
MDWYLSWDLYLSSICMVVASLHITGLTIG